MKASLTMGAMLAYAFGLEKQVHDLHAVGSHSGHGSAGYGTPGAFGKSRGGSRRSMRRAAQLAKGKFVRC